MINKTKLREDIVKFATKYVAQNTHSSFDDFETISGLTYEMCMTIDLPFGFDVVTGEDAYIQVVQWYPQICKSVILDGDFMANFHNADDFADEVMRTYEESIRIGKLLDKTLK